MEGRGWKVGAGVRDMAVGAVGRGGWANNNVAVPRGMRLAMGKKGLVPLRIARALPCQKCSVPTFCDVRLFAMRYIVTPNNGYNPFTTTLALCFPTNHVEPTTRG